MDLAMDLRVNVREPEIAPVLLNAPALLETEEPCPSQTTLGNFKVSKSKYFVFKLFVFRIPKNINGLYDQTTEP
jgi:hypothetical protein